MQQGYAKTIAVVEEVHLPEIVEDALRLNQESLERHRMDVIRELGDVPAITIDKHQVLQILVNLVSNAKHAMRGRETPRKLTIRGGACPEDSNCWFIEVSDTGMGIAKENLERIFSHGFTTRADGHGFGLHSSILAAQAMSGSLTAHSDGPGTGATFTLKLPISAAQKPQDHQRAA
jgi:signal transduction histidine kinase